MMDQRDPLEECGNIRKDLEEEILQGKSPKADRRHAQIRLGFVEKYKHIRLEMMIKENAKNPTWGTQLISAFESLYGLGEELLQLSAKGEEQRNVVESIDKELQDISGTTDILRSLGYRCIDDTSAIAPTGAQINLEDTSAVLAELLLAKDEMVTFLSGKHVLHDDICQLIPAEYCPTKKRRLRKVSTNNNTQIGRGQTFLGEATREDKTDFPEAVSNQPTGLPAEESRCSHCDFINLADASLCISCAEPLIDTSQSTSRAEPLRNTSLSCAKSLRDTSLSNAEPLTDTNISCVEPLTDTLSHAEPLTGSSVFRAESATDTRVSSVEQQAGTSVSLAETQIGISVSPAEQQAGAGVSRAENEKNTSASPAETKINTSVSRAERDRETSGLEVSQKTEPESQTLDKISCPYCTFVNPRTEKICSMCFKTMILSPIKSPRDEYVGAFVKLPDTSATYPREHKSSHQNKNSEKESHNKTEFVQPNENVESTEAQQRQNEDPGCPECTFQNPLPTNFCKMCGHRLTKVGISTDYSSRRLLDPAGYQKKQSVKAMPESTGGQNECDQSQYKKRDGYLDTKVSSSQHMMQGGGSKEFIRCPSCKGALRDDVIYSDRRICIRCDGNYCNKCSQPFLRNCSNPSCPLILHCHHGRTCLYMLRQYSYTTLQKCLEPTGCQFASYYDWYFTMRPGRDGSRFFLTWEHQLFYKDYLINKIHEHRIDPAESMTDYDLIDLVKHGIGLDIKSWETSRENLLEFVKTNMPL